MYTIIRLMISIIVFIGLFNLLKRNNKIKTNIKSMILVGISFAFMMLLMFIPFENYFITFKTPEAAYEYYYSGESTIALVVEGTDCDFLINRKDTKDTYLIVPKTKNGWKVGIGTDIKDVCRTSLEGKTITIYQYKNTKDYFVVIQNINGGELTLSDSYNSEFHSLRRTESLLDKTFVSYYAHIYDMNLSYILTIDDKQFVIID